MIVKVTGLGIYDVHAQLVIGRQQVDGRADQVGQQDIAGMYLGAAGGAEQATAKALLALHGNHVDAVLLA